MPKIKGPCEKEIEKTNANLFFFSEKKNQKIKGEKTPQKIDV